MSEVYRYRAGPALPLAGGGIVITGTPNERRSRHCGAQLSHEPRYSSKSFSNRSPSATSPASVAADMRDLLS
jgi:hypothetical protein